MSKIWKNNDIIGSTDAQRWEDKPSTQDLADLKKTIESGNVKSADKLKTAREIAITGNATGSAIFDGSQNINISTTIASASTSKRGLVQLSNDTNSAKDNVAATSKAVSYKADLNFVNSELSKKADKSVAQMWKLTEDSGYAIRKSNDANECTECGFYILYTPINAPQGWQKSVSCMLLVISYRKNFLTQIIADPNNRIAIRHGGANPVWTDWVELTNINALAKTQNTLQKAIDLKSDTTYVDNADKLIKADITKLKSDKADKTYVDNADNTIKQSISSLDSKMTANLNKKADKSVAQMYKLTNDFGTTTNIDNIDLNGFIELGFFDGVNLKNNYWGNRHCFIYNNSVAKLIYQQIAINLGGGIAIRIFTNNKWGNWQQLATTDKTDNLQNQINLKANKSYTWNRPVLENGWQNYGNGYQEMEYTESDTGLITLRGNIKNTQSALPGGMSVARLPKNVAPKNPLYFEVITGNYERGFIAIQASGEITTRGKVSKDWLCFDGISYKI